MRFEMLSQNIYLFTGDEYDSNAVLVMDEEEGILIDGLASHTDAVELKEIIESKFKKKISYIISTHYFSDHMAAFKVFTESKIIAHKSYLHTFTSELYTSEEEKNRFIAPSIVFDHSMQIRLGSYTLNLWHNPGHTLSTIAVEIEGADVIVTGDHVFGNVAYLSYSTPEMVREALMKIVKANPSTVITGHHGRGNVEKIRSGLTYLDRLERYVKTYRAEEKSSVILDIPVEDCVSSDVVVSDTERIFHQRNLQNILEKGLFL